jgi:hypothetical protein
MSAETMCGYVDPTPPNGVPEDWTCVRTAGHSGPHANALEQTFFGALLRSPGPAAGARVEELLIAQRGPVQERLVHLLYRFATDVCGIANDDAEKYANEVVTDCLWRTGIRGTDMGEECGRFARAFAAAIRKRDAAREPERVEVEVLNGRVRVSLNGQRVAETPLPACPVCDAHMRAATEGRGT